ncbi:MAG: hypothetical protein H6719_37315 [Sandaracinaceae bacterium]|nr:hypothetical protein [Sandaracinaceae bacterium]
MAGGNGSKTDRFRTVFEPEAIFDRFVKNANGSTELGLPDDDEVTGCVSRDDVAIRRGGPPAWDHQVTVVNPDPKAALARAPEVETAPTDDEITSVGENPTKDREGTRPDAPMPLAMRRAFGRDDDEDDDDDPGDSGEGMTVPRGAPLTTDSGQRILLLTKVKESQVGTMPAPETTEEAHPSDELAIGPDDVPPSWQSVVAPRGQITQRIEAAKLVPDVESVHRKTDGPPSGETGEDGQIPTREMDHILSDMAVLLRYGHAGQVRDRLDALRREYPEDLLLLRRIAEFHLEHEQRDASMDALFALARGLFERRNVEGMRQALEQVLILDPPNARAHRLLGLLEARADGTEP